METREDICREIDRLSAEYDVTEDFERKCYLYDEIDRLRKKLAWLPVE